MVDPIDKNSRAGVDVANAFSAIAKNSETEVRAFPKPEVAMSALSRRLPNPIRGVAKALYRLLKPIIRPIAFRLRQYFIVQLQQGIQQQSHLLKIQGNQLRMQGEQLRMQGEQLRMQGELLGMQGDRLKQYGVNLEHIEQYSLAAARRIAVQCNEAEILVNTGSGFVLCSATDYPLLACLIDSGELEQGIRLLIQRFLHPGDVFIDVGANIGLHTLAAARALQGCGKVIAFEPFEPTKRLLEKSVWMNGFSSITEIHQAAVANVAGQQQLFLGAVSGHHSLFPLEMVDSGSATSIEVPLVRLDDVVSIDQRVNLLKVDVEGAELAVIESAAKMIANNPEIGLIVEFGPSHLKRSGHTVEHWFDTFINLGLAYQAIHAITGVLEDCSVDQLVQAESTNLFFARKDSQAWMRVV